MLNGSTAVSHPRSLVTTHSLLVDLVQYHRHTVEGVMTAAQALLTVYREEMSVLLARREKASGERKWKEEGEMHDGLFGRVRYSVGQAALSC